jgi:hypothetical protein
MEIRELLGSRRYCPANTPQLNCQLNYSAISFQPPLQNSTDLLLQLPWLLLLGTDHIENPVLLLRAYSLPRECAYRVVAKKRALFIRLISRSLHSNGYTRYSV